MLLLPVDLASSSTDDNDHTLLVVWYLIYWTTFCLSWLVLPVLMEYASAGEFTFRDKMKSALRANAKFYFIVAVLLVFLSVYVGGPFSVVVVATFLIRVSLQLVLTRGFTISHLPGFLMTAGNTYGLLFIIVFMGYGTFGATC